MFSQQKMNGNPSVHAIDNALEEVLSSNTKSQKRYLEIIRTIFSTPNSEQALAKSMVRSFGDALKSQASEETGASIKETLDKLQPLFNDLGTIAQPRIRSRHPRRNCPAEKRTSPSLE